MSPYYWNNWYSGWGWFLWFGVFFLFFSGIGNWGYTYRAHRRLGDGSLQKNAMSILNERLARGDIDEQEFQRIRSHILPTSDSAGNVRDKGNASKNRNAMQSPIHSGV